MMPIRLNHVPFSIALVLMLGVTAGADEDRRPKVSLVLSKVSAERTQHDALFRCDVVLENDTGGKLAVTSNFFSAFDGLELVVTNKEGIVLVQQPYTFHQSPSTSDGRQFALPPGKTKESLVFPVRSFGTTGETVKVRLVGMLPGSSFNQILSTDTLPVVIAGKSQQGTAQE